jgi:uncharacterized protein YndB with AHSA1/START domain
MIDVKHQIGSVDRLVVDRQQPKGETRSMVVAQVYAATVEELWDACTDPERIPRWFLPVTGDLEVGGHYQLESNAGGTITECQPPHRFAATWEFGDTVSWIEVRLTDEGEHRARFELEHTVPVDAHWEEFGPGAVGLGWELAVMGLALHLASGEPVDAAEVMAWQASDEGREFMALSSGNWCDAHVASGTPVDVAEAAAARCLAAYTGG